jgi:DnaJ like chaperone protein
MFILGKIVGALFGWLFAGPLGLMAGVWLGHYFDRGLKQNLAFKVYHRSGFINQAKTIFFDKSFEVMGYMAKIDGHVSKEEISVARAIMQELQLDEAQKMQAINSFNRGKQGDYDIEASILAFRKYCGDQPNLVQLFLEIQLQSGYADGALQPQEKALLQQICHLLGCPLWILEQLEARFTAERAFHQPYHSPKDEIKGAYGVLGVEPSANDSEVKQAYRKLMNEHHPDKLAAKGLPEAMRQVATQKTQQIQKAYNLIRDARGLK